MFKIHKDSLRMEPTPERVYALCRFVARGDTSRQELQKALSLFAPQIGNEIPYAMAVAMELALIKEKDGTISLAVSPEILKDHISFRRYVANRVFKQKDTTFFKVTKWYLAQNDKIFEYDNWEDKAAAIRQDGIDKVDENDFLGWRFWASFLGIGYLFHRLIIPNLKIRLQDVLATHLIPTFDYEESIAAKDFVNWLIAQLPEVTINQSEALPLALSNGLLSLHELNLVELKAQMDAYRVRLYPVHGASFQDFSHIIVKEVICSELG